MVYNDGWLNVLKGLGRTTKDATRNTTFNTGNIITDNILSDIYIFDGIGAKIIKAVADDMTKEWISIPNDEEGKILKELKRLKVQMVFNQALRWNRCFGGSLIVIGFENGGDLSDPVKKGIFKNSTKRIAWLKEIPRSNIYISNSIIDNDVNSPTYGEIEKYSLRMGLDLKNLYVHKTRTLEFKGIKMPPDAAMVDLDKRYWGMSVIQQAWEQLQMYGSASQSIGTLLLEFIVGVYTLAGLQDILAEEGGEDRIIKRMEVINLMKSIQNAVLLDENENYSRNSATVTGLPELMDRFMMNLSCVTEYPVTRLFGRSPAGQNATGESDLENYYDKIHSDQTNILETPLQKIVNIIAVYLGMSKNVDNVDYPIVFNPLYQMSDKEKAEVGKIKSETNSTYINDGVISAEEVREKEFPELGDV